VKQQIKLPRIKSLTLKNFSLYETPDNTITVDFEKPASCIIGANGLGKSTLLNCINYGLTVIIKQVGRKPKQQTPGVECIESHA